MSRPVAIQFSPEQWDTDVYTETELRLVFEEAIQGGSGTVTIMDDLSSTPVHTMTIRGGSVTGGTMHISGSIVMLEKFPSMRLRIKHKGIPSI